MWPRSGVGLSFEHATKSGHHALGIESDVNHSSYRMEGEGIRKVILDGSLNITKRI